MPPGTANITVVVRVRPLSQKEVMRGAFPTLEVHDGFKIDVTDPDDKMGGLDYLRLGQNKDRSYAFDHAMEPGITQRSAFEKTTSELLPDVMQGRNACCFAYGATGSGKTFTMTGSHQMPGIIPHTVDALFEATGGDDGCVVMMQYVEIYNEMIKDLLQPSNGNLDVREVPGRGTFVAGAANVEVTSRDDVEELLNAGNAQCPMPNAQFWRRLPLALTPTLTLTPNPNSSPHANPKPGPESQVTPTAPPSRPISTRSPAGRTLCSSCALRAETG